MTVIPVRSDEPSKNKTRALGHPNFVAKGAAQITAIK